MATSTTIAFKTGYTSEYVRKQLKKAGVSFVKRKTRIPTYNGGVSLKIENMYNEQLALSVITKKEA